MAYEKLLIWQYRNKFKAVETIRLMEKLIAQHFIDLVELIDVLNIEKAKGVQLDLIGKHIGQSRVVDNYEMRDYFGFLGGENAKPFSKEREGGGKWYRRRDPLRNPITLNDDDYRFLIKARIIKNYNKGTLANIYQACLFLCGVECVVIDNFDMTVTVSIPKESLSVFQYFALNNLDVIPRQAGIRIFYEKV